MENELQLREYEQKLNNASANLLAYAETVEDDLAVKIMALAEQTNSTVKGIEGDQKVRIPQLLLRQNSSNSDTVPPEAKPGQFYTSFSVFIGDSFSFIPVYTHNIRKKWGEEKIDCQSLDGITGTRYGVCASCPHGQYDPNARPECSSGTAYYVVAEDLSAIYRIEFTKTSAQAGRVIRKLSLPPNMWSRSFTVSAEKKTGNNRNYFTMKVAATPRRTNAQVSKVCDILYEYFHSNFKKMVLVQAEYLKRGVQLPAESGDPLLVENTKDIDFSDSM